MSMCISEDRMQDKLAWVTEYTEDIAMWQECQNVVSKCVTFINEQYLFKGASQAMKAEIGDSLQYDKSKEISERLVNFVNESEQLLRDGERLPMSTEILESSFGLFKQLEGQQSKSGFTSLLACFPALLHPTTPEEIKVAFDRVSPTDVHAWIQARFPSTVTSRRQSAYAEYKATIKRATNQPETT